MLYADKRSKELSDDLKKCLLSIPVTTRDEIQKPNGAAHDVHEKKGKGKRRKKKKKRKKQEKKKNNGVKK